MSYSHFSQFNIKSRGVKDLAQMRRWYRFTQVSRSYAATQFPFALAHYELANYSIRYIMTWALLFSHPQSET